MGRLKLASFILQPCMGLFLQGAVKALAVVEVGVNFVMLAVAIPDYGDEYVEILKVKEYNFTRFCINMTTWIYCHLYKAISIAFAFLLFIIVSNRNRAGLHRWLILSATLYLIWLCCFVTNTILRSWKQNLSFAMYCAMGVYKLYFFWTTISFSNEIKRNGVTDKALCVLSDEDLDDFFKTGQVDQSHRGDRYKTTFEIPLSQLLLDTVRPLGSGQFGVVYKATLIKPIQNTAGTQIVAVKTVIPTADVVCLKSLVRELQILNCIGNHENIVNLVGACTSEVKQRKLYVIVEYCALGSIQSYLEDHRSAAMGIESYNLDREYISREDEPINFRDLVRWAKETANGLEYIANNHVIHGDLAARNVLLTFSRTAKVADFGLSKQLYRYATYARHSNEQPIPWRWMAWECLDDLKFTTHSDSWSYGITVWEYFSLGATPYPGLSFSSNFVQGLKTGQIRPDKPLYATNEIYQELCKCWAVDPTARPSFSKLKSFFAEILDNSSVKIHTTPEIHNPSFQVQPSLSYVAVGDLNYI